MTTVRNETGDLIGFCYGYIGEHGQYWTDYVAARIHPSLEKAWLGGHFEVGELAVDAAERGKGFGKALLTTLPRLAWGRPGRAADGRAGFAGAPPARIPRVHRVRRI